MLTEPIQELVATLSQLERGSVAGRASIIETNRIITAAATFYEKVRYLVDYHEEHTIRRNAIERMLKRRLFIQGGNLDAEKLLRELVESQYLLAEEAHEETSQRIGKIIKRFLELSRIAEARNDDQQTLASLMASEIESYLSRGQHLIDTSVVSAFYSTMRPHIVNHGFADQNVDVQTYCACRRALVGSDDEMLWYDLWLMFVPQWKDETVPVEAIAQHLRSLLATIHTHVHDPMQWRIVQRMKNENIFFRIVREMIMREKTGAISTLENMAAMDAFVRTFMERISARENERIQKSGLRAVAYLLLTKMVVALLLEIPYQSIVLGSINYFTVGVNALFHPTLLFVFTRKIGSLDEANTNRILEGIHTVLYGTGHPRSIVISSVRSRLRGVFAFLYLLLILGVFGAILTLLQMFSFDVVSTLLFLLFLALVSYFAFRIRYNGSRWRTTGPETMLSIFVNVIAVPIVYAGRWLSRTFSSINIFVIVLDFILETPFRHILDFSHHFIGYLKEKAEEVYS